jgi:protein-L-isoaspartate(D-aspartate) O-methyltransferase
MLEQLAVEPGQRVLEIGAGTGYNAALLAELVGPAGQVVSIEIDEELVAGAREHLARAGYSRVQVVLGDGALGYAPLAPYDRLILTTAARDIAPAWWEQLRAPGGRLVLPLAIAGPQRCVAFEHLGDHLASRDVLNCSFIPLRGLLAVGAPRAALGPHGEVAISLPEGRAPLPPESIYRLLGGPTTTLASGVRATIAEVAEGLVLWLAAREPGLCSVWADAGVGAGQGVPELFGSSGKWRASLCLLDSAGLALLAWGAGAPPAGAELVVRVAGDGRAAAERLIAGLAAWEAAGRPTDAGLRIRAYRREHVPTPTGTAVIEQRWTRFVLDWEPASRPPA